MLFRFSLYGFLKNQRYFEPFLLLALLERGASFAQIGMLVAIREVVMQLLEVPSGALADALGRRRVMVCAFVAYVGAYVLLGVRSEFGALALGMGLIGFGDAFRSGTHKAMIFDWLRRQGRTADSIEVYGFTRSWSRIGSVVAIPIAIAIAIGTGRYAWAFLASAIPSALDAINLATYPRELDGDRAGGSLRTAYATMRTTLRRAASEAPLRRLLWQAMAFGGSYKAIRDYVQPLIVAAVASTTLSAAFEAQHQTAVASGLVYMGVFAVGAVAARRAHRFVGRFANPQAALRALWFAFAAALASIAATTWMGLGWVAIALFVAMAPLFDVFRPTLIGRLDEFAGDEGKATLLSIESQASSAGTAVLALFVGAAIDASTATEVAALWPVAAIALLVVGPTAIAVARSRDHCGS